MQKQATSDLSGPDLVARLRGKRVLVVGDLMLDQYLRGDAERISPEAPVPVVHLTEERRYPGGAGNVARNIAALGGRPCLMGIVGNDEAGRILQQTFPDEGVEAFVTLRPDRVTTVKTRVSAQRQQMVRIDREEIRPLSEEEEDNFFLQLEPILERYEVFILSDYGKGLVGVSFMERLGMLLHSLAHPPLLLIDPRPEQMNLYRDAYLLTPNAGEIRDAVHMPARSRDEIVLAGREAKELCGCRNLLITLGAQGMALFQASGEVRYLPTAAQDVFDVSGAGDTVIATLALALAAGLPLLPSCILANFAAGVVVAKVGTATVAPTQLLEAVKTWPTLKLEKWA